MNDPTNRPSDPEDSAPAAGRRRFLEQAAALVAAAPLAAALHAVAQVEDAAAAAAARKTKGAPKPKTVASPADPFAASRPDLSICRTAEERATLEKQWKGLVDLVKVVRDAPLDPSTEPATVFAALPREA